MSRESYDNDELYHFRGLRPTEGADIMRLYDVAVPLLPDLATAGAQRNAMRHATNLGLLIVAALCGAGNIDQHSLFALAVKGAGWTPGDVEEFLGRDPDAEGGLARLIQESERLMVE